VAKFDMIKRLHMPMREFLLFYSTLRSPPFAEWIESQLGVDDSLILSTGFAVRYLTRGEPFKKGQITCLQNQTLDNRFLFVLRYKDYCLQEHMFAQGLL
jgi:hypothetical protein